MAANVIFAEDFHNLGCESVGVVGRSISALPSIAG